MPEKILVVDDEPLILSAIERSLKRAGYFLVTAKNMQEFTASLSSAPYDLLITDLHMEDGSADAIIKKVKKTSPAARVLIISGSVNTHNYKNFLEKPFKISDLRTKVRHLLDEPA